VEIIGGWEIVQHLYPRLVVRESFVGDGSDTTFQLDGTLGNGTFEYGGWVVDHVKTTLPAHATKTNGGALWDSLLPLIRNRVQVSSISSASLCTLSHAPRDGIDFYIWYWYELRASDKLIDYYREDFIAKMEGEAGVNIASAITTDTANFNGHLSANDDTVQKALDTLDDITAGGDLGAAVTITLTDAGVAALSGPGYYKIATYDGAATDDMVQITGLAAGQFVILMASDDAKTVVVKDGTNIKCRLDFELDSQYDGAIVFCLDGTVCIVWRSNYA